MLLFGMLRKRIFPLRRHTKELTKAVNIIVLPPERWREAKRLRLEALREESAAFASSYEDELAFRDEVWRTRLTSAFERDGNLTFFAEVDGALIGMAGTGWSARAKLGMWRRFTACTSRQTCADGASPRG